MDGTKITIELKPTFALQLCVALENYAGVIITGKIIGTRKNNHNESIEKAVKMCKYADRLMRETTSELSETGYDFTEEDLDLIVDYYMAQKATREVLDILQNTGVHHT